MAKSSTTFQPGKSGNPKGKPKGQTPRGRFREQVDAALPEIVDGLVTAAKAGDVAAAKLVLDRCIPALRPTSEPVKLPVSSSASLADQAATVTAAALAGKLDTDTAKALIELLTAQAKIIEQEETENRLEALDKWQHGSSAKP